MRHILLACVLSVAVIAKEGFGPTDQEWGYVTVKQYGEMFWWLHYTTANVTKPTDRPLVIWLQGGPGSSSTGYGNFAELGPLDTNLEPRNTSWDKYVNVLFVDNPVGTGFSYVLTNAACATTNREIANDFVELLKGFFNSVPAFRKVPLYIFSESYGGKMTAEIALVLDQEIKKGNIDCQLKGVGLGDSWISPNDSVQTWAPYLLNLAFVDQKGYLDVKIATDQVQIALDQGQYRLASALCARAQILVSGYINNADFYNVLTKVQESNSTIKPWPIPDTDPDTDEKIKPVMIEVQNALNISRKWGSQSAFVFEFLQEDFMKPVTSIVEELLNSTDVFVAVYNGQLDLIVDTPGTMKWVENLKWTNKTQWNNVSREGFVVDEYHEGFVKKSGNLGVYWVNRAGHMVPADNPSAMYYILKDVTNNFTV